MRKVFLYIFLCLSTLAVSCKPDAHSVGIRAAIERQLAAYPESTLQDVYKSFYQGHFGPEHMIANTTSARQKICRNVTQQHTLSRRATRF